MKNSSTNVACHTCGRADAISVRHDSGESGGNKNGRSGPLKAVSHEQHGGGEKFILSTFQKLSGIFDSCGGACGRGDKDHFAEDKVLAGAVAKASAAVTEAVVVARSCVGCGLGTGPGSSWGPSSREGCDHSHSARESGSGTACRHEHSHDASSVSRGRGLKVENPLPVGRSCLKQERGHFKRRKSKRVQFADEAKLDHIPYRFFDLYHYVDGNPDMNEWDVRLIPSRREAYPTGKHKKRMFFSRSEIARAKSDMSVIGGGARQEYDLIVEELKAKAAKERHEIACKRNVWVALFDMFGMKLVL